MDILERERKIKATKDYRRGYQSGHAQGKRDRMLDEQVTELMEALSKALDDTDLNADHPSAITLAGYTAKLKPRQERPRKLCKGSVVRWKISDDLYAGGTLTKFVRYELGEGEVWSVQPPQGDAFERLITHSIVQRYGPKRGPRVKR